MDIGVKDWNRIVVFQCLLPIGLTTFIMVLVMFIYVINRNRQMLKIQYNEKKKMAAELEQTLKHVKRLQGILPICAKCKKIRDEKGYWNQIESYIKDHSEADFSHSICSECAEELYGDHDWFQHEKRNQPPQG
jgi:sensor c-di-GMP phosphodiesterase-like protein